MCVARLSFALQVIQISRQLWSTTTKVTKHAFKDSIDISLIKLRLCSIQLVLELEKHTTWGNKLQGFLRQIPDDSLAISTANQAALCTAVYMRLLAVQAYDSNRPPIRTPIVLLKPTAPILRNAPEDYDLGQVSVDYLAFVGNRDLSVSPLYSV